MSWAKPLSSRGIVHWFQRIEQRWNWNVQILKNYYALWGFTFLQINLCMHVVQYTFKIRVINKVFEVLLLTGCPHNETKKGSSSCLHSCSCYAEECSMKKSVVIKVLCVQVFSGRTLSSTSFCLRWTVAERILRRHAPLFWLWCRNTRDVEA